MHVAVGGGIQSRFVLGLFLFVGNKHMYLGWRYLVFLEHHKGFIAKGCRTLIGWNGDDPYAFCFLCFPGLPTRTRNHL